MSDKGKYALHEHQVRAVSALMNYTNKLDAAHKEIERAKERERQLVELIKTAQPIVLCSGHENLSRLMKKTLKNYESEVE